MWGQRALQLLLSLAGVALLTYVGYSLVPVNATTIGFAYLLLVLIIASLWGFFEASLASIAATLTFNFFFLPPVGRFTIADPQNWVALFSFLTTALIASRLSAEAKRRALDAVARQQDLERLYTFSRAILLIDNTEPFPKQLVRKARRNLRVERRGALRAPHGGVLSRRPLGFRWPRRSASRCGPAGYILHRRPAQSRDYGGASGLRSRLRASRSKGAQMPDAVLQGIANLVAIGLERARAQDLASQIEAARRSEKLRTTLLDAMAHEFKTPLTSIMAATSALLANPDQPAESKAELVKIADEEAKHLNELIDDAVEMGRLDTADIQLHTEPSNVGELVREVVASMRNVIDGRPLNVVCDEHPPATRR